MIGTDEKIFMVCECGNNPYSLSFTEQTLEYPLAEKMINKVVTARFGCCRSAREATVDADFTYKSLDEIKRWSFKEEVIRGAGDILYVYRNNELQPRSDSDIDELIAWLKNSKLGTNQ